MSGFKKAIADVDVVVPCVRACFKYEAHLILGQFIENFIFIRILQMRTLRYRE